MTFNFVAAAQTGIFRTAYFLGASSIGLLQWNVSRGIPGPFYQVLSPAIRTDLFRFQLTTNEPAYDFGAVATATATLHNDRATSRTFTLQPLSGLDAAPVVVTVGAHGTAT